MQRRRRCRHYNLIESPNGLSNLKSGSGKVIFIKRMQQEPQKTKNPAAKWIKRFGVAGFMFFFIKGLIWLALIIGATYFGYDFLK